MEKIKLKETKGKYYEYSLSVMGQERVLLTKKELKNLQKQIKNILKEE